VESPLSLWHERKGEPWIDGIAPEDFAMLVAQARGRFVALSRPLQVAITTPEPLQLAAAFLAALTLDEPADIFLGPLPAGVVAGSSRESRIMIATGGTTGAPRYAVHTWATLAAAARGLQAWLGGGPIDSVCCLPLRHVSGLMQLVRSFVSGGRLTLVDLESTVASVPVRPGAVISLVPTQLARVLERADGAEWLRQFRAVFLGGAPAWPGLLERTRAGLIPLAPCYGSTETAAQVVALPPAEFLTGVEAAGRALPHAQVEIVDEITGAPPPAGTPGRVRVRAASLFLGYWPEIGTPRESLLMDDRGVLAADGRLSILGRADALINTGGEKVDPLEVEAAIRATGLVADVAVVGVPDAEWGERVVAIVAGLARGEDALRASLRPVLASYKVPKRFVSVPALPRNEAGKLNRTALRAMAAGCEETEPP
jgi:o-succinylbenzoate---CoA ligase